MIEVSVSEVKAAFSEYVNRAAYGKEIVLILSRGRPKAAIISVDALHRLEELESAQAKEDEGGER